MKGRMFGILVIGVLVVGLVGCGKQDVDYVGEGTATDEMSKDVEDKGVPVKIIENVSLDNGAGVVDIDADVINGTNYGKLPVAKLEKKPFSADDMKQMAESVFDEGSIEVVLPYMYRDMDTLLEEQAEIQAEIQALGFTQETIFNSAEYIYLGYQLYKIKESIDYYDERHVIEFDASIKWYSLQLEGIEDVASFCNIKGTIAGKPYAMNFFMENGSCSMTVNEISGAYFAETEATFSSLSADPLSPRNQDVFGENVSDVSAEEAVSQAKEFAEKIGITDFTVVGCFEALQYNDYYSEEQDEFYRTREKDGYIVYLAREVAGYPIAFTSQALQFDMDETGKLYGNEFIEVLVDENGVVSFCFSNPMQIKEVVESVAVTDFSSMHQSAVSYIKNQNVEAKIYELEIGLHRIAYENDSYAVVPVIIYVSDSELSDVEYKRNVIAIVNVIDGTMISPYSGVIVD